MRHTSMSEVDRENTRVLQEAIHEHTRKLDEVWKEKQRVEEETLQCTKETEQRVHLIKENLGVVDLLKELGPMVQEEQDLSKQLDSEQPDDGLLEEWCMRLSSKMKDLASEISNVTQQLEKAKARNVADEEKKKKGKK